jgi:DNA-binding response OmpR family regulator
VPAVASAVPLQLIESTGSVVTIGGLEIHPDELQAFVHGARVNFTVREFETFYALAARCDRVVSRNELYEAVWGRAMPHRDRSVDVFVRKVRRKLAAASPGWTYVHTHFGIGYRFSPERTAS